MSETIAYMSNAKHVFGDGSEIEIGGLDLDVSAGQKVAILGPNGSGKTTMLLLLMGLLRSHGGRVELFGLNPYENFDKIKKNIGVIFQNIEAQLIAPTVREDISYTPRNYNLPADEIEQRVRKALVLIGIEHIENKIIHYLSGGEKKKVALAGAMVMEPLLLILDEPFAGLDPRGVRELTALLQLFNDLYGTTVIFSSHNVEISAQFADQLYVVAEGNIAIKGVPADIFKDIESLKKANLQAPGILELTYELKKNGLSVSPTSSLHEAVEQLTMLVKKRLQ